MPGSAAFAGEFAILLGVFKSRVGLGRRGRDRNRPGGDVLAAAHLGGAAPRARLGGARRGRWTFVRASSGSSCRSSLCLLALSVWPAAITERSFADGNAEAAIATQLAAGPFTVVSLGFRKESCGPACTGTPPAYVDTSRPRVVAAVPTLRDLDGVCPSPTRDPRDADNVSSSTVGSDGSWHISCQSGRTVAVFGGDRIVELTAAASGSSASPVAPWTCVHEVAWESCQPVSSAMSGGSS